MTAPASIPALIAEGRRLIAAAAPGDWASGGDEVYAGQQATYRVVCRMADDAPLADDNADLIAFAVNNLAALLDVAEAGASLQRAYSPDGLTAEKVPSWYALDSALSKLRGVRP